MVVLRQVHVQTRLPWTTWGADPVVGKVGYTPGRSVMDLGWRPEMRTEDDLAAAGPRPPTHPRRRAEAAPAAASAPTPDPAAPDLPGCRPIRLKRRDLDTWDGRFEYWDGGTETAWVMRDPTGIPHEHPSQRLAAFCTLIAAARGAPIESFGSTDLELRDERGERHRILQADQCVYVYPGRARIPETGGIVVGMHDLPDVVLEVDHTTDVRRWKLGMYEWWGFPEVWVEVPERWSRSRARGRVPGLTIHVLEGGRYRESPVSTAFPDWRARAIHEALNEAETTGWTHARLAQVGRALGARDGTGPDDHHFLRSFRDEGRAEGREQGRIEGQAESRGKLVRQMLVSRGISVSEGFPAGVPHFAEAPEAALVQAALACDGEQDFRARIRRVHPTAVDRQGKSGENGSDPR